MKILLPHLLLSMLGWAFVLSAHAQIPLSFTFDKVVAEPQTSVFNPTGEFIFPTVIRAADHVSNPMGAYYMYYAPHDSPGGIALRYSNSIDGPWIEYSGNPIVTNKHQGRFNVTHVSSPHVRWMPQYNKFFMYFHGENTTTRWAHSFDGINWDLADDNVSITRSAWGTGFTETSYARVYEYTIPRFGNRYIMLMMVIKSGNGRTIGLATSDDGKKFTPRNWALVSARGEEGNQASGASYMQHSGRHYVLYHTSAGNIYQTEVGANFDRENHLGPFYVPSAGAPERSKAADPFLIYTENNWHMFYTVGTRLSQRIAHAKVSTGWTPWLNRDDPGGTGDFETRHSFTPSVCASASAIEARVVGSSTVYTPGSATPDNLHMFSTSDGLACRNADQGSGVCRNYEVRFFCGSNFTRTIQAESFSASQGVQVESTTDSGGGQSVGWIESGDWMAYNSINIPASGTYTIEYRVASPNSGGRLSLDLNGGSTVLGQINIPNTGGWQNWRTISHTVHINAGTYNFGIFAQTGGWNINWWRIRR